MPTLPTTEKQMRSLKKLPTAELRLGAWTNAVQAAGGRLVSTRDVEREVRKFTASEKGAPVRKPKNRQSAAAGSYQIGAKELRLIRAQLRLLGQWTAKAEDGKEIRAAVVRIGALLPKL